jgi:hypothetical protein
LHRRAVGLPTRHLSGQRRRRDPTRRYLRCFSRPGITG